MGNVLEGTNLNGPSWKIFFITPKLALISKLFVCFAGLFLITEMPGLHSIFLYLSFLSGLQTIQLRRRARQCGTPSVVVLPGENSCIITETKDNYSNYTCSFSIYKVFRYIFYCAYTICVQRDTESRMRENSTSLEQGLLQQAASSHIRNINRIS